MSASESIWPPNFDVAFSMTGDAPVDAVEEGGEQHHGDGQLVAVLEGQPDAGQAGADGQDRDDIGDDDAQRNLPQARTAGFVVRAIRLIGWKRSVHRFSGRVRSTHQALR